MRVGEATGLVLVGVCFTTGLGLWTRDVAVEPPPSPPKPKVRLAVLIVVDQLRGDLPKRWESLFGDRGFRRLAREGAWFQRCYYPYASTFTAAGHASLVTGCSPYTHGIIGNDWYDRASGKSINAARTLEYRNVPLVEIEPEVPQKPRGSGTPERLRAPTVADVLKKATRGKGKVVALSVKERSAVMTAGERPDACYWADAASGLAVTSSYYRGRPHSWVEEYNRARPTERWLGKQWQRLRSDLDYDLHAGPDDAEGEDIGYKQGRIFPHPFAQQAGEKYYESVANSPFGNQLLLELTKRAIAEEKLGQDNVPDLLTVCFSSNDLVGHTWGPDSHEVLDITLRTDRDLQSLLQFLDAKVGRGQYAIVLSADHGVSPLPEKARREGKPAGRVDPKRFGKRADEFLQEKYGPTKVPIIDSLILSDFYLNRDWLKAKRLQPEEVEKELAEWARHQPEVQAAYTRTELSRNGKDSDLLGQQVRRSYFAARNGDVILVLKPHHFFWDALKLGTTHGSPHDYDRHVPLMVLGPGVRQGVNQEDVTPQAAAAILAHFLGIAAPGKAEAPVPETLFEKR